MGHSFLNGEEFLLLLNMSRTSHTDMPWMHVCVCFVCGLLLYRGGVWVEKALLSFSYVITPPH